ncbi:alpha-1,2-mannosyltransferase ALG11, partial [Ascoidea rubescens DSM 1968]
LGALRKRIITGSFDPSFYSTNKDNYDTISFSPLDKDPENRDAFINGILPRVLEDFSRKLVYGFFHPYCNAGGGGERVLWETVKVVLNEDPKNLVVVYTGDDSPPSEILSNVSKRFNVKLENRRIVFIYLTKRYLVDTDYWKHLTLLGQAYGSIRLVLEAINALPCDIFIDTMGFPFTYFFVSLILKIPILSYTHYPIISNDMLNKLNISEHKTNPKIILKYIYWNVFMILYTFCGTFISVPLTNSTWTYNHIKSIWCSNESEEYELVDFEPKLSSSSPSTTRDNIFLSIAQFRPEKRHDLTIREFSVFLKLKYDENEIASLDVNDKETPKLVLIGSIRNEDDRKFVDNLIELSQELKINRLVKFLLDISYSEVLEYLNKSSFGINAMWNEHFGIAVVEYLANGLIPIVHASAGPYLDICIPWNRFTHEKGVDKPFMRTGFFFKSELDPDFHIDSNAKEKKKSTAPKFNKLSAVMLEAFNTNEAEKEKMRQRGRDLAYYRFSNEKYDQVIREKLEIINK